MRRSKTQTHINLCVKHSHKVNICRQIQCVNEAVNVFSKPQINNHGNNVERIKTVILVVNFERERVSDLEWNLFFGKSRLGNNISSLISIES